MTNLDMGYKLKVGDVSNIRIRRQLDKYLTMDVDTGSLSLETIGSSTTAFEYDSGGNLTAWGASTGWQYSHNRLTEVPSKGYEFYYTDNGERAAWFQTPTMPDGAGYRLRADANGDDCVDDADLGIVLEYYGCEAPWTGACAGGEAADLNEDGIVDDTDLAWVSEDYGAFAWLYEYDVYGNLVYAGSPCVGEYEAAYDAFGRRVWERGQDLCANGNRGPDWSLHACSGSCTFHTKRRVWRERSGPIALRIQQGWQAPPRLERPFSSSLIS